MIKIIRSEETTSNGLLVKENSIVVLGNEMLVSSPGFVAYEYPNMGQAKRWHIWLSRGTAVYVRPVLAIIPIKSHKSCYFFRFYLTFLFSKSRYPHRKDS